jgi:hypothetical protein
LIILNVSNSVTPKINGFIKSSVAYGLQSNTFNSETVVENSPKPKTKTFSVIFNQVKQKIDVFFKFFLGQKFFFSSGTIFGTIFSSKSFLTATSRLFINKNIKSFDINVPHQKFPIVLGIDEHLTYCASELEQKQKLEKVKAICGDIFLTTLCDYKNAAPYKKKQVDILQEFKNNNILIEHNISDTLDKQSWNNFYYFIENQKLSVIGPYQRRTMYFKQLAKYSSDLGCREYVIQKQSLYRGFAKQHWEHIITVRF